MSLDHAKHARLRRELHRNQAAERDLSTQVRLLNVDAVALRTAAIKRMQPVREWDPNEPLAVLMRVSPKKLAAHGVDVKLANESLALSKEAEKIQGNIDELRIKTEALVQLVARLDAYVKEATL